jgi:hypothetical protein
MTAAAQAPRRAFDYWRFRIVGQFDASDSSLYNAGQAASASKSRGFS